MAYYIKLLQKNKLDGYKLAKILSNNKFLNMEVI